MCCSDISQLEKKFVAPLTDLRWLRVRRRPAENLLVAVSEEVGQVHVFEVVAEIWPGSEVATALATFEAATRRSGATASA